MSLGAAAYNPYNTSFGDFAMRGLQMAQANMEASERQAQQTAKSITDSFVFAADLMQRSADNKARDREASRLERADEFKEMAFGVDMDFKRERASVQDKQFDRSFSLDERRANQEDRRAGLAERAQDLNEESTRFNQQWNLLQFSDTVLSREQAREDVRTNPQTALAWQNVGTAAMNNAAMSEQLQTPGGRDLIIGSGRGRSSIASEDAGYQGYVDVLKTETERLGKSVSALDTMFTTKGIPFERPAASTPAEGGRRDPNAPAPTPAKRGAGKSDGLGDMPGDPAPIDYSSARSLREEQIALLNKYNALLMALQNPTTRSLPETNSALKSVMDQMRAAGENKKINPSGKVSRPEDTVLPSGWDNQVPDSASERPGEHNTP